MSSILKVDQIQLADGSTPTATDLGLNTTGTVVSYQYAESSTVLTMSGSSSFATFTGMSVTLTPKNVNNMLVVHAFIAAETYGSYSDRGVDFAIYQDGSEIYRPKYDLYMSVDTSQRIGKVNLFKTITAGTTNSTTINMNFRSTNPDANCYTRLNNYGGPSSLHVWEIAG